MIDFEYEIVYGKRRTVSITVKPDGKVIVRAPLFSSEKYITSFVQKKSGWIKKYLLKFKSAIFQEKLSKTELLEIKDKASVILPQRVAELSREMGIAYNGIRIKTLKTLWGSCSVKGNLNFNCLLVLTPEKVIDYVIVHELCHRKEMNHSKKFWKYVASVMPDYKECNRWLKDNGAILLSRL